MMYRVCGKYPAFYEDDPKIYNLKQWLVDAESPAEAVDEVMKSCWDEQCGFIEMKAEPYEWD